jgi:hypothetical protein
MAGRAGATGPGGTGGTIGGSGGGAGRPSDDACAPLGNDRNHVPERSGCYAFDDGGWVRVPCRCEVVLENPTSDRASFVFRFLAYDGVAGYSPDGQIVVSFADVDAKFFDLWQAQPENGNAYVVTRDGMRTEVALNDEAVLLPRVWLEPCEARAVRVRLSGTKSIWLRTVLERLMGDVSDGVWTSDCNALDEPPPP